MTTPILPTADQIVTAAVDRLRALRPETDAHFNRPGSRWQDLREIWRAELLVPLGRMADEVKSARLRLATGESLRATCASEFQTVLPSEPQAALADIFFFRASTGTAGTIRKGTLFVKKADPKAVPLSIDSMTYESIDTVYVPTSEASPVVRCVAQRAGAAGNVPAFSTYAPPTSIQPASPLFDPTLTVIEAVAAGGSSGLTDPVLVAASRAYAVGQFGPTDGAIVAGILRQQSVRHYALFRASDAFPYASVYIADESWGAGVTWPARVSQVFATGWQGFGCRARFGTILNLQIAVTATIMLASTDDLNDTDAIDANVRAAARSYFDDRADWYRWKLSSLQNVLSKADDRILQCTAVSVTNAVTGATVPEPSSAFGPVAIGDTTPAWPAFLTHYYLTDNNCQSSYEPPL